MLCGCVWQVNVLLGNWQQVLNYYNKADNSLDTSEVRTCVCRLSQYIRPFVHQQHLCTFATYMCSLTPFHSCNYPLACFLSSIISFISPFLCSLSCLVHFVLCCFPFIGPVPPHPVLSGPHSLTTPTFFPTSLRHILDPSLSPSLSPYL